MRRWAVTGMLIALLGAASVGCAGARGQWAAQAMPAPGAAVAEDDCEECRTGKSRVRREVVE